MTWLRHLCLALPGTEEVVAWRHPNFRVAGRTFAVFEIYRRRPCIAIAGDPEEQALMIERFGFFRTPYVGNRGWVSAWVDQPPPLGLLRALVRRAHRRAAKRARPVRAGRTSTRRRGARRPGTGTRVEE